jgi:hypothetical protein
VRIKPTHEAPHVAATLTAWMLDLEGNVFFSLSQRITAPLPFDNSPSIPYRISAELNHSRCAWIVPK